MLSERRHFLTQSGRKQAIAFVIIVVHLVGRGKCKPQPFLYFLSQLCLEVKKGMPYALKVATGASETKWRCPLDRSARPRPSENVSQRKRFYHSMVATHVRSNIRGSEVVIIILNHLR